MMIEMEIKVYGENVVEGNNSYMVDSFAGGYMIKVNLDGKFSVVRGDWLSDLSDELKLMGFDVEVNAEAILDSQAALEGNKDFDVWI
jgi:hypothetical protein